RFLAGRATGSGMGPDPGSAGDGRPARPGRPAHAGAAVLAAVESAVAAAGRDRGGVRGRGAAGSRPALIRSTPETSVRQGEGAEHVALAQRAASAGRHGIASWRLLAGGAVVQLVDQPVGETDQATDLLVVPVDPDALGLVVDRLEVDVLLPDEQRPLGAQHVLLPPDLPQIGAGDGAP